MAQKKQLMNEVVYNRLRTIIAGRRFEPGQRINVEELARELGVSRTPVWEAVRMLGREGVLRNVPNRGVFMATNPLDAVRDIIQVRSALDCLACGLAVEHVGRRTIEKLSRCLPEQLTALERGDVAGYYASDVKFHRLICEAAGNGYLRALYESITTHVFPAHFNVLPLLPSLHLLHREIVVGLSDHDRSRVEHAMARHGDAFSTTWKDRWPPRRRRKRQHGA